MCVHKRNCIGRDFAQLCSFEFLKHLIPTGFCFFFDLLLCLQIVSCFSATCSLTFQVSLSLTKLTVKINHHKALLCLLDNLTYLCKPKIHKSCSLKMFISSMNESYHSNCNPPPRVPAVIISSTAMKFKVIVSFDIQEHLLVVNTRRIKENLHNPIHNGTANISISKGRTEKQ